MPSYAAPAVPSSSSSRKHHEVQKGFTRDYVDLNLHSACAKGDLGLATYALYQGQPVNSAMNCILPIHAAASTGNDGIIQLLIDHGADVNALRLPHKYANDRNKVAAGTSGSTPLHFAAANGHTRALTVLLTHGANPLLAEKHGFTPEMVATRNGHAEAVELLRSWIQHHPRPHSNSVSSLQSPRSFDTTGRKNSGAPLTRLSLHLPRSSSGLPSPIHSAPATTLSFHSRRDSSASSHSDTPSHRRPSLPSVLEKAAHPATALKNALASRRQPSAASDPVESSPPISEGEEPSARRTSVSSLTNTPRAQFVVNTSLANNFYRPRQMSQLSKGSYGSGNDSVAGGDEDGVPPRTPVDTDHSRGSSDNSNGLRTPEVESSVKNPRPPSEVPVVTLQGPIVDPRRAAAPRDRADSTGSTNSSFSRWTGSSVVNAASLRNVYSNDVMQAGTTSQGPLSATRTHRSDSTGTEGRVSSSPASSYSGPETFSTYAHSNSTTSTSVRPPSPSAAQTLARQPGLEPLYESAALHSKSHKTSVATTSSEARSRRQMAEQELLAFHTIRPKTTGRLTLTQQLAAYGESLSIERKLAEQEQNSGQSSYRYETIKKDGSRQPTPLTPGELRLPAKQPPPALPPFSPSSITPIAKSPIHAVDDTSHNGPPQWRAIPSDNRLMPPPAITRHGNSPVALSSSSSAAGSSRKLSRDSQRSKDHVIPSMAPPTRTGSPSTSTLNTGVIGSGVGGKLSYVEVSPPSSTTARQHRPSRSVNHSKSIKTHSARDSASSTTTRDQIEQDAADAAALAAAVPKAVISVPSKKKLGGLRRLFGGATKV